MFLDFGVNELAPNVGVVVVVAGAAPNAGPEVVPSVGAREVPNAGAGAAPNAGAGAVPKAGGGAVPKPVVEGAGVALPKSPPPMGAGAGANPEAGAGLLLPPKEKDVEPAGAGAGLPLDEKKLVVVADEGVFPNKDVPPPKAEDPEVLPNSEPPCNGPGAGPVAILGA